MLEPGRGPDLTKESLRAEGGRELLVQNLEGNRPVVAEIPSQIHRGHASVPELALQHVTLTQGFNQSRTDHAHRRVGEDS